MFASQQIQPLDFSEHSGFGYRGIQQSLESWEVVEDVYDHADHPDLITLSELPSVLPSFVSPPMPRAAS